MPASSSGAFKAPPFQARRVRSLELMDEPGLDPLVRAEVLKGIERISTWWGQRRPLLRGMVGLLGKPQGRKLRLVEVGAGSGHFGRWVQGELVRAGYDAEVLSTDLLPSHGVTVLDALDARQPEADLYFSSLLLHHLGDWQLCRMLRLQAKASRLGFAHFDLQRHFLHYHAAAILTRLAGLHEINLKDALLSIQQGYTRAELEGLARAAGLPCQVSWSAPFRWLLTHQKY